MFALQEMQHANNLEGTGSQTKMNSQHVVKTIYSKRLTLSSMSEIHQSFINNSSGQGLRSQPAFEILLNFRNPTQQSCQIQLKKAKKRSLSSIYNINWKHILVKTNFKIKLHKLYHSIPSEEKSRGKKTKKNKVIYSDGKLEVHKIFDKCSKERKKNQPK